jgi:hypothetical protein
MAMGIESTAKPTAQLFNQNNIKGILKYMD